jgi:hypothetical protein
VAKATHAAVHYGKGMPTAHCSICVHYVKPTRDDDAAHCKIVRDPIRASDWCNEFAKVSPSR